MTTAGQTKINGVPLQEYIEAKLQAIEEKINATEKASSIRFDHVNALRNQLESERGQYISRSEHVSVHDRLSLDMRELMDSKARLEGKASMSSVYIGYVVTVASLVIAVASLIVSLIGKA